MTSARAIACLLCVVLLGGFVFTQPPAGDSGPDTLKAPSSLKLQKQPFRITLTVKGILAPAETAQVSYRPHVMVPPPPSQGPVTIRAIVEHGAEVQKGDILAEFDTTKIDEVIADLERDQQASEASLKLAELEQPFVEKSVPIELAAANSAKQLADEALKYFLDVDKAQRQKQTEWMVKSAKFQKEYAEEELHQLEKMYKANDLTEETERMILRRQQNWVEQAAFWYRTALLDRDYMLKFTLPNREKSLTESQRKQDLALTKAQTTLGPAATQKQMALLKMRYDRDKNRSRLAKIRDDRDAMTIRAPMAGTVYYGRFHKGQWGGTAGLDNKLTKGGNIMPEEVFMTVVKPRPVVVHVTIDEKDVHLVKAGLEGKAKVLADPDRKLAARVVRVAPIPSAPGKFEAEVVLNTKDSDTRLAPGMACSIHFVPYAKKDAIAIASRLIREEDDRSFVDVVGPGGKTEKREVKTGRTDGERVEILDGLRAGELVLLERSARPTAASKSNETTKEKGTQP